MLAQIWFGFFAAAFIAALYQWLVNGQAAVFTDIMQSTFDMAALSVEIAIGLIGEIIIFTHARDLKEYTVEEIIN